MIKFTKKFWFIVLLVSIIPTFTTLLKSGYFPMHDDMQVMRVFEMDKCIKDGQIPCRWVPDMGYGYGYPQFNYYGPFPYYVMEAFHLLGFGFLDSVKIGFILSVLISGMGMFLLASSLWGGLGGFISGFLFAYAPYRAVDMYVRGAVGEFWALSFFPFIFWSIGGIIKGNKKSTLWLALSLAALFMSHNISTIMFLPFVVFWIIFLIVREKKYSTPFLPGILLKLFFAGIWGFSIAGFFIIPAWLEKGYVHIDSIVSGYFNYLAHFIDIKQALFSTYWAYGSSEFGPYDGLFLGVGLVHWILPLSLILISMILRKKKILADVLFLTFIGWLALFMTHSKSTFIWKEIGVLEFVQFPWRFLIIVIFLFSLASGSLSSFLEEKKSFFFAVLGFLLALSLLFYGSNFRTNGWLMISDKDKFSGDLWQKEQTISIFDYLPIYAKYPPIKAAPDTPTILKGEAKLYSGEKGTDWESWQYYVLKESRLELPLYYFPGWVVMVDGKKVSLNYDNELGLINFTIPIGSHDVYVHLNNTPVRSAANLISLIGIIAIPFFLIKERTVA